MTLKERMEKGEPYDRRSVKLYRYIAELDFEEGGDVFCFKSGGDGDNGEHLMYLLDCALAEHDRNYYAEMKAAIARVEDAVLGRRP